MTEKQWQQGNNLLNRMTGVRAMLKAIQDMRDNPFASLWVGIDDGKDMVVVPERDRGVVIELLERGYREEYDTVKKEFEQL